MEFDSKFRLFRLRLLLMSNKIVCALSVMVQIALQAILQHELNRN